MTVEIEDIKRIVSLQLGIREVGVEDRFMEELGAESLDVMTIIVTIEEKYGVVIKESEIPELQTSAALFALVTERS
ncbi:MAG: phosphopantetheine-binding protein [Anaerolineales bacterium]|nr:phosphopantetheine-binding protein [Anaerolineales bacterium]